MKYFFRFIPLFITLFFVHSAQGQISFPKNNMSFQTEYSLQNYLKNYYVDLNQSKIDLILIHEKNTNVSKHYTFQIQFDKIAFEDANIYVHLNNQDQIISIKRECPSLSNINFYDLEHDIELWKNIDISSFIAAKISDKTYNQKTELVFKIKEDQAEIIAKVEIWNKQINDLYWINRDGKEIAYFNKLSYLNKDSLVQVKIFNPDPLTTANQIYGGIYVDSQDVNLPWMDAQYEIKTVMATFDDFDLKFYLENSLAKIDDFEAPVFAPSNAVTPEFLYTRDQSGFEDANAFYHITNFHNYISSLGYDSLMNIQLLVDAHGQFGSDNSAFNRNGGVPTISFGVGGIDDAEDADVIIHEYSHGLSWSANGNSNFSPERSGLDEGLADYFATSYSRAINNFNWERIFNWDGNFNGWNGRTAVTNNNYPSTGNIYAKGEIWNAAMSGIWTDLGPIITDKLMLEALHFFSNNTTLPEAALYVMQADTLLFGGVNANVICQRFKNKNIFDQFCRPLSTEEINKNEQGIIRNSLAFAQGLSPLVIHLAKPFTGDMIVINLAGKVILQKTIKASNEISLDPNNFKSDMYFLRLNNGDENYNLKFIKW